MKIICITIFLKDEFHQRLRFVRRGLVAMANAGPNDNQSQFFFTLGATPELNGKHTIFGKVISNLTEALKIKNKHTICACVKAKLIINFSFCS